MTPTLQDVAYLLGLPLAGDAVGPRVVPPTWLDDLEARFADIDRLEVVGPLEPHPVGDVTPGYPRGGPKYTRPDRVSRADRIPADSIRTVRRAKTTGGFQRCRTRSSLYS